MNKKIIALLLGAALTTGIGGFGTYAYFTDRAELSNKVNITMGELKSEVNWTDGAWVPYLDSTEVKAVDNGQTLSYENVKPGDVFYRDFTITNAGTLEADTIIQLKKSMDENIKLSLVVFNEDGSMITRLSGENLRHDINAVQPGVTYKARIEMEVNKEMGVDWMNKNINADAHTFMSVDLHQTIH